MISDLGFRIFDFDKNSQGPIPKSEIPNPKLRELMAVNFSALLLKGCQKKQETGKY